MVKCREFSPILGVRSFKSWTKGASKIDIHLPNFAMTKAQYSEAGKSLDALVEREYYHLVDELATGQEEGLVSMTLREAVRQAEKVSDYLEDFRATPADSSYQVLAHQGRLETVHPFPTCFQELQHLWTGDFGYTARGGRTVSLLQPCSYTPAFGRSD